MAFLGGFRGLWMSKAALGESPPDGDLHDSHGIVVKDSRNIFGRKLVGCVGDEQTGLSDGTVPHHDTPRRSGLVPRRGGGSREARRYALDGSDNHIVSSEVKRREWNRSGWE